MISASLILSLSNIPIIVTTVYAFIKYKALTKELRIFSWFLLFSVLVQSISAYLGTLGINNMVFLHVYIYGSVGFLGWFYSEVFNGFINKRIFIAGIILFWVVATTDIIMNDSLKEFNSFLLLVQSILFIIVSLFAYSFMLNETIRELKAGLFYSLLWINSGLFIYYSSSLLLFYFDSTIKEIANGTKLGTQMWVFHAFFITVMYSCFFVGIWKQQQK